MENLYGILQKTSKWLAVVAGVALTAMMLLTVADVAMRAGGRPIMGTYEVVGFALALVIGFSIPKVSLKRQHIYMDFVDKLSKRNRALMNIFTRILCIILFVLIGYSLFSIGNEFWKSGEVSPTIKLPFFPVAYGVGICCFIECFVFLFEIVKSWRAIHE
jgi:TRAP-type C4-dicarboxylate transport system permease small subunit